MNKKTIIIIVFTLIIVVVLYSSMKKNNANNSTAKTDEEKAAEDWANANSAANRYDNDDTINNSEKDQKKQTITQSQLNKIIPEFWDIFRAGTTDGDRRRVVQLFNDYFFTKADVLALIDQYDEYAQSKNHPDWTFSHDYFLAMARNDKKQWNEKVNKVLANNGVKYQFVNF